MHFIQPPLELGTKEYHRTYGMHLKLTPEIFCNKRYRLMTQSLWSRDPYIVYIEMILANIKKRADVISQHILSMGVIYESFK